MEASLNIFFLFVYALIKKTLGNLLFCLKCVYSTLRVRVFTKSHAETCADLSAGVIVWKDTRVIRENFVYSQFQRMNQWVLINSVAENDHH